MSRSSSAPGASESTSKFRSDIQGLRAVAVLAVVFYHAGVPFISGGYVGVDVFFVISGFLITGHLLNGLRRDGRVQFANFYARRVRRILPAAFVVLVLSIVAALIWYPPLLMREVWQGAIATALYIPNYLFASQGTNYLAEMTPSLFQHYWSLGIEEQFYLLWPLLLAAGFALIKSRRVLFAAVCGLVLLSFVAGVLLTFRSQPWAFFALPTRAWELGVGAFVAFLLTYRPKILKGVGAAVGGWVGVAGILGAVIFFDGTTQFPGYWAAVPVVATALVIISGDSAAKYSPNRALSLRPMMWIGLISYSLYLVHWPLLQVPQAAVGFENPLPLLIKLALAAASVPLAWLLYKFVETPGRTGAWLARARPRRSLLAAGAASLGTIVIATGVYTYSNSLPLHAERTAAEATVSAPPVFTEYVPSNLRPSLRDVSNDQPAIYSDGCHLDFSDAIPADCVYGDPALPRIVLFGDSHAAQWFPALLSYAESRGYSLENHTKSSCSSASVTVLQDQVPYQSCTQWREKVIERINVTEPDLVVISNSNGATLAESANDPATVWKEGLSHTLTSIAAPTIVLADTPRLSGTPSVCLSANLETASKCGLPREQAMASSVREAEESVVAMLDVRYIDLTDHICSPTLCAPVVGDTLVYRDAHHLTATWSDALASVLGEALDNLTWQAAGEPRYSQQP